MASESPDILKLRILLCFRNEDSDHCTVTGLSKMLGEGKQKISRLLIGLEKEGLLDRTNQRNPRLTQLGQARAAAYGDRVGIITNSLLYEGVELRVATQEAYARALYDSDESIAILRGSEACLVAKRVLRGVPEFDGIRLCRNLQDGDYSFPFIMYREMVKDGSNISMANAGFEHPCVLSVRRGVGTVVLTPVNITATSRMTGKVMTGRVRNLRFCIDGKYYAANDANEMQEQVSFPASALHFRNMGAGAGQLLHGSVCLRMQCSVGTNHMPESVAVFTMFI